MKKRNNYSYNETPEDKNSLVHRVFPELEFLAQPPTVRPNDSITAYENGRQINAASLTTYTSNNHALYLGQVDEDSTGIYRKANVKGLFHHGFSNIRPGETLQIYFTRQLGEYLNPQRQNTVRGKEAANTQRALLQKIGKETLKLSPASEATFQIFALEDLPQHQRLFSALEKYYTGSHKVTYLSQVFKDTEDLPFDTKDSYDIARYLYWRTQKHTYLAKLFAKMVPDQVKGSELGKYYPMIELAIRIWELIHGQHVQGGMERQMKYDPFILALIDIDCIRNATLRKELGKVHEVLPELAGRLAGTTFQAAYLDSLSNAFIDQEEYKKEAQKIRKIITKYLGIGAGVTSLITGGAAAYLLHSNQNYKTTLQEHFKDKVYRVSEHNVHTNSVEYVLTSIGELQSTISEYFDVEQGESLRTLIEDEFIEGTLSPEMLTSSQDRKWQAFSFMQRHRVLLKAKGYDPVFALDAYISWIPNLLSQLEGLEVGKDLLTIPFSQSNGPFRGGVSGGGPQANVKFLQYESESSPKTFLTHPILERYATQLLMYKKGLYVEHKSVSTFNNERSVREEFRVLSAADAELDIIGVLKLFQQYNFAKVPREMQKVFEDSANYSKEDMNEFTMRWETFIKTMPEPASKDITHLEDQVSKIQLELFLLENPKMPPLVLVRPAGATTFDLKASLRFIETFRNVRNNRSLQRASHMVTDNTD